MGTFATTLIIDKFGRKILLLISDFLICVSMVGVGVFFALRESCEECRYEELIANGTTTISPSVHVSKDTVTSTLILSLSL